MTSDKFDNSPLTTAEIDNGFVDWAESLTTINSAYRGLNEAIPMQNRLDTLTSFLDLEKSVLNLRKYLESRYVLNNQSRAD